ncbi:MAG TPA: glycosyltransferase [Roseiflexaceae bacterium]|nr:glycosyltransferase [Roseiflexaceae bacterium]HMP43178.1 glycosyltransferase [Roseiflexaceae bacterium]
MMSADDRRISDRQRVALLSAEYAPQPGGIGDYTQQLAAALRHGGTMVTVISGAQAAQVSDIPTYRLPLTHWDWRCWQAIMAACRDLQADILHIQYQTGAYGMHPAINFLPWRLRRIAHRPAVAVTAHDLLVPYLFPKAGVLRSWVTQRLLGDADMTIVTNQSDHAQAARFVAGSRLELVPIGSNIAVAAPDGYDRAAWRAQAGINEQTTLVVFFGLISRTKGLDTLLAALAIVPGDVRLMVVGGEAPTEQDKHVAAMACEQIAALGLRDRVIITGHLPAADVSAHLLAADIVALPYTDGASFRRGSLLAALTHGIPIVTTGERYVAAPDGAELCDGVHALLVPPGDAAALALAISRLRGDRAAAVALGAAGQQFAARFGWNDIAERHRHIYQRMLGLASKMQKG